jgi:hypothetical protein
MTDDTSTDSDLSPAIQPLDDDEDDEGNVAGSLIVDSAVEPQDITLENALFVALGVLLTTLLVVTGLQGI